MSSECREITIGQMKRILKHAVMKHRESCLFRGTFGVGKTHAVRQFIAENPGIELIKIHLGQYQDVDLKGTPWVVEFQGEGQDEPGYQATVWRPASTLPFIGNPNFPPGVKYLIFFDEITSAKEEVLGIAYQMLDEHRCGEHVFGDNVYICAAGNLSTDKGIVRRLPMPMLNRTTQFKVVVSAEESIEHWKSEGFDEMICEFFNFRKELTHTYDPKSPHEVVSTPRTIEKMNKYYIDPDMEDDIKDACMAGAVGDDVVIEFRTFLNSWAEVSRIMPNILRNPGTAPVPGDAKPSLQYAVAVALSRTLKPDNAAPIHTYLKRMPSEFTVMAWQMATKRKNAKGVNVGAQLMDLPEWVDFTRNYAQVFQH
jgi:hypothetical protein